MRSPVRSRAHGAAATAMAALAILFLSSSVVATTWAPSVLLRQASSEHLPFPWSVSAAGVHVAAGWQEFGRDGSTPGELFVRTSRNSGDAFDPKNRLAVDPSRWATDLALDSGHGHHVAAWAEDRRNAQYPGRWRVFGAIRPLSGQNGWTSFRISTNQDKVDAIRVAVTPARVFVAYVSRTPAGEKVVVQSARLDEAPGDAWFGPAQQMGTSGIDDFGGHQHLSLDATASTVSLSWADFQGRVFYRRGLIAAGPSHGITWLPPERVATGGVPVVVARGDLVALFWARSGHTWVRVSKDGGATFATPLHIGDPFDYPDTGGADILPGDAAMAGDRIVLVSTGPIRIVSNDAGSNWHAAYIGSGHGRRVTFTAKEGRPKLAQVAYSFDQGSSGPVRVRYQRED